MIKFEHTEVVGWEHAIRGMRNPMNSWEKSDSFNSTAAWDSYRFGEGDPEIGPNDLDLMMQLRNAGTDHRKFMRMITVYVDITAPLYWWKEFDTYKVGTVANSCSTMHKIAAKRFERDDFSHEHLMDGGNYILNSTIDSIHFEQGAQKYGENNWQKGIPVHCYIDSAIRHYLKYKRGDDDERHDRAFVWNILCAIWTCKEMPQLNGYGVDTDDNVGA